MDEMGGCLSGQVSPNILGTAKQRTKVAMHRSGNASPTILGTLKQRVRWLCKPWLWVEYTSVLQNPGTPFFFAGT